MTAIGTSIVGLAGQTRIREYVDVGLGTMMSSSSSAAGVAHAAHVCSEPELLLLRSYHEESAVYGRIICQQLVASSLAADAIYQPLVLVSPFFSEVVFLNRGE